MFASVSEVAQAVADQRLRARHDDLVRRRIGRAVEVGGRRRPRGHQREAGATGVLEAVTLPDADDEVAPAGGCRREAGVEAREHGRAPNFDDAVAVGEDGRREAVTPEAVDVALDHDDVGVLERRPRVQQVLGRHGARRGVV